MTAVTAVTAQNTRGVAAIVEMTPEFVGQQIDVVVTDIGVDAGEDGNAQQRPDHRGGRRPGSRDYQISALVVDPVMISKGGAPLLRADAREALRLLLLPLALVVTPNLHEAGVLLGREVRTVEGMEAAARALRALGPRYVVVKGGHLDAAAVDVVFDGESVKRLEAPRIRTHNTHGTGCIFSAAITAELARGTPVPVAIERAKRFITARNPEPPCRSGRDTGRRTRCRARSDGPEVSSAP